MLKPQDLRIGNFVQDRDLRTVKVVEIHESGGIWTEVNNEHGSYIHQDSCEDVSGIILTEDWLVRLGFKDSDFGYFIDGLKNHYAYYITISDSDANLWQLDRGAQVELIKPTWDYISGLYYVHQLQNLIFSLEDKQLTLTP